MISPHSELPRPFPVIPVLLPGHGVGNRGIALLVLVVLPFPEFCPELSKEHDEAQHPKSQGAQNIQDAQQDSATGRE